MNLWDLLFPRRCVGCSRVGRYVCADCINRFRTADNQKCPMCGKGSMYGLVHARCKRARGMDGLTSVLAYQGVVRRVITKLKYKWVRDVVEEVVEVVVSLGDYEAVEGKEWVVVPVPLSGPRERERGFNQASEIGKRWARALGWKYGEWLVRRRNTRPQVGLSAKDRQVNVRDAFGLAKGVDKAMLAGKEVMLVDDVWTTGATMRECAKVLKMSGARVVWGMVVAS